MINNEEKLEQSSLVEQDQDIVPIKNSLKAAFQRCSEEDIWYELYKSITNEKDMAEKD
jgi:hypothetical protein